MTKAQKAKALLYQAAMLMEQAQEEFEGDDMYYQIREHKELLLALAKHINEDWDG